MSGEAIRVGPRVLLMEPVSDRDWVGRDDRTATRRIRRAAGSEASQMDLGEHPGELRQCCKRSPRQNPRRSLDRRLTAIDWWSTSPARRQRTRQSPYLDHKTAVVAWSPFVHFIKGASPDPLVETLRCEHVVELPTGTRWALLHSVVGRHVSGVGRQIARCGGGLSPCRVPWPYQFEADGCHSLEDAASSLV